MITLLREAKECRGVAVADLAAVKLLANYSQMIDELAEDKRLVAVVQQFLDQLQAGAQLGASKEADF